MRNRRKTAICEKSLCNILVAYFSAAHYKIKQMQIWIPCGIISTGLRVYII